MNTSKTISAILIDSEAKEIKKVYIDYTNSTSLKEMYKVLKCDVICAAFSNLFRPLHHALFVDDEGLLRKNPIGAFKILDGQPLSGNGIIVSIDEDGDTCSSYLDLQQIKETIIFCDVKDLPEPSMMIFNKW